MADPATVAPLGTPLTPAESRVLAVMCDAATEREAATELGISPHTVHAHLANARSRLGVKTTRQAIVRFIALHAHAVDAG